MFRRSEEVCSLFLDTGNCGKGVGEGEGGGERGEGGEGGEGVVEGGEGGEGVRNQTIAKWGYSTYLRR